MQLRNTLTWGLAFKLLPVAPHQNYDSSLHIRWASFALISQVINFNKSWRQFSFAWEGWQVLLELRLIAEISYLLWLVRASFFYASRKYLLRALYHDLKSLTLSANDADDGALEVDVDIELDELPEPVSSNSASPSMTSTKRQSVLHSTIARTSFSLCFSESCTLFLLFMCQELHVFQPK